MSSAKLDKLLQQAHELSAEERRQLRDHLIQDLSSGGPAGLIPTEDEFEQGLVEAGLLAEPLPPDPGRPKTDSVAPIPIQGEPLSETVIEDRR